MNQSTQSTANILPAYIAQYADILTVEEQQIINDIADSRYSGKYAPVVPPIRRTRIGKLATYRQLNTSW
jgi:hypothetical protein